MYTVVEQKLCVIIMADYEKEANQMKQGPGFLQSTSPTPFR